jgi:tripartite-type tricarboxylate transporter receptor subunit TctC
MILDRTESSLRARLASRWMTALVAAASLLGLAAPALSQQYPNKPIRLVVGFPPGSGPDVAARIIAQKLQDSFKDGVVVDNKPGAAGFIAAQEVARAAPDGYALLFGEVGQLSIAPSTYNKLPYDPQKDFAPVSQVVSADFAFVIPPGLPPKTVKEYAEWAKAQKQLFMATFGAGTPGHFGAVVFGDALKLKPEPVHYKSTGDAMTGTLGGDVQGLFGSIALTAPHIKGGKLRALAMTGPVRSPLLPDVPTFKELGYPDLEFSAWFGVLAPAKTPPEVLDKLNAEIIKVLKAPDGKAKLEEAGFRVTGTSRADFGKIIGDETVRWGKIVKASGFKALD